MAAQVENVLWVLLGGWLHRGCLSMCMRHVHVKHKVRGGGGDHHAQRGHRCCLSGCLSVCVQVDIKDKWRNLIKYGYVDQEGALLRNL
jgi:hypothetical protein